MRMCLDCCSRWERFLDDKLGEPEREALPNQCPPAHRGPVTAVKKPKGFVWAARAEGKR